MAVIFTLSCTVYRAPLAASVTRDTPSPTFATTRYVMLTLHRFGLAFGLPDGSPFCVKAMVLLKMSGLEHTVVEGNLRRAPKGKFPVLDDNDTVVPDSTFIRWHLEQRHSIDFDKGLNAEQRATALAFEKLCEDHLYWGTVHTRWMIDEKFNKGPRSFFHFAPAVIRPAVVAIVRRGVKRNLDGQGFGRHTQAEITQIMRKGINGLADFLGDKPFLMGEEPCGADATTFAWAGRFRCPLFDSPILEAARARPNLIAYRDRGLARWFPGFGTSDGAKS
jgi:glutathione S-transferase